MQLSNYAIESMGYKAHSKHDILNVKFSILRAYTLQGMVFDKDCEEIQSDKFSFGKNCTLVISKSINEASKLLVGDVFADDEDDWLKLRKAKPPFVLIYFSESSYLELKGGYRKEEEDCILTYDAFPTGKKEIKKWEKEFLPSIITALTVHFSAKDRPAKLVLHERSIFGTTTDGERIFDTKATGKMEGYVSSPKKLIEINSSLQKSADLLGQLDKDISRHFYMALTEKDRFKQFLYYFLFIERYTHREFKSIDYEIDSKELTNIPDRLSVSTAKFFKERHDEAKNLMQRFHWCAILKWKQFNDSDIETFKEVKKVRDGISHGEEFEEELLPVEKVKSLALNLLSCR